MAQISSTAPKTTITVSFGTDKAAQHLSAQIMPELNDDKDSFAPGDTVYISIFKSSDVTLNSVSSSSGTATITATVDTVALEDEVTFENAKQATLSVPAVAITSTTWIGTNLGAITLGADKVTITAQNSGVAIAKVKYTASADRVKLVSPSNIDGELSFSILVMVFGTVA